ncbi:MAG TPA: sugar ABC transporter substrate-binding protein [Chloroflexota bacterium]|nr:sugar ABC transporter substrate-binding protein [Chloroflexota bacterium]
MSTAREATGTTRRSLVLNAGVLGAAGLLAACGAGGGGQEAGAGTNPTARLKGNIRLSVWGAVYEDELYTAHYIPEFQRQFPEVQVEFIRPAGNYRQALETAHAGGEAPDVMRQHAADAGHYVKSGMDRPLDEYIKVEKFNREDFYPHHWPHLIYNGKTYGIPQDTNQTGAYANRRLFQEAGLKVPDENYSYEQLVKDARALSKTNATGNKQYALVAGYGIGLFYPLVFAQGGRVYKDAEKKEILLSSEPFLKAAEFFKRNLVDPGYMPTPETLTERGGAVRMFYTGEAAILFDGTHRAPFTLKEAPDVDWVAIPYPTFGQTKKTIAGFPYWSVWSQSKAPDAAAKMIFHMQSGDGPIKYWQLLWVAAPANKSAVKSPAFKKVPGMPGHIPSLSSEKEWQEKCAWQAWTLDRSEKTGTGNVIETEHISQWGPIIGTETGARVAKIFATTEPVRAKDALEDATRAINGYIKQHG